ncbi:MAG: glycosyltransferase family 2 protein, partial [Candidatus Caldarchaeum sp.]
MRLSLILTIVTAFATMVMIPFVVGSQSVFWTFVVSVIFALVLLVDALVSDGGRRKMLIPSMVLGYSTVVVPSLATLLVFVEEFNFFRDWYKPIMLSSYAALFLTNLMFLPLAAANYSREEKNVAEQTYFPSVSVIVPAYNEEKWIGHCIEALLENDYPNKEIIVVDDGSVDGTYEIASRYVRRGVTVLRKPNGGKASALNYGMLFATGEIIVTVDADSILTRDTLR